MKRGDTQAMNHPRPGSSIKVEPICDRKAITRIKDTLRQNNLRDYCLFTLGINTAYRASELLSLTVGQVMHLRCGNLLEIKQTKTGTYRATTLNNVAVEALQSWLKTHPELNNPTAPLFLSQRTNSALTVPALNHLVKKWCKDATLTGNYGSHTLRKTWGYHQRKWKNTPIPLLMVAFGHATESQTLAYLHIQERELSSLYTDMEL